MLMNSTGNAHRCADGQAIMLAFTKDSNLGTMCGEGVRIGLSVQRQVNLYGSLNAVLQYLVRGTAMITAS